MANAVEVDVHGIKCDNPDCTFEDDHVKFEEYPSYLNKPCPLCGQNLLTQEDLDNTNIVLGVVGMLNKVLPGPKEGDKLVHATMNIHDGVMTIEGED